MPLPPTVEPPTAEQALLAAALTAPGPWPLAAALRHALLREGEAVDERELVAYLAGVVVLARHGFRYASRQGQPLVTVGPAVLVSDHVNPVRRFTSPVWYGAQARVVWDRNSNAPHRGEALGRLG